MSPVLQPGRDAGAAALIAAAAAAAALVPAGAALCALAYRIRGSARWRARTGLGDTSARALFGTAAAAVGLAAGWPPWSVPLLGLAAFAGCTIPLFDFLAMRPFWPCFGRATAHGCAQVGPLVAVAAFALPDSRFGVLAAACFLCGPAYALAYALRWTAPEVDLSRDDRPPLGELLWGGAIGGAVVLAAAAG